MYKRCRRLPPTAATAVGGRALPPPPPAPGSLLAAEARDWSALPWDIILDIFLRLGPREVMLGAEFACKPWRRVALEEPSLWRRVGMEMEERFDKHSRYRRSDVVMDMKLVAVDRAAGQCEAFKGDSDDEYLLNLVERAPSLKCLDISHYMNWRSGEDLIESLKRLPLVEDLHIHFSDIIDTEGMDGNMLQSICQACPGLKNLVLWYAGSCDLECNEDEYTKERIDGQIPLMPKLHTLELSECELKGEGLKAILDSCPELETLCILHSYLDKCEMDEEMHMKCARVKNRTLPTREWSDIYGTEEEYYSSNTDSQDDYSVDDDDSVE